MTAKRKGHAPKALIDPVRIYTHRFTDASKALERGFRFPSRLRTAVGLAALQRTMRSAWRKLVGKPSVREISVKDRMEWLSAIHSHRNRKHRILAVGREGFAMSVHFAAVLALAVVLTSCTGDGPTAPDPVAAPPPPVAQVQTPTSTTPPASQPADGKTSGFELSCKAGGSMIVSYFGPASLAQVDTWYTSFDNQDLAFAKQSHQVAPGGTVERVFPNCTQGDADQPGVKLIGGCFYDINGDPFIPSRSPEKVTACRNQCVPRWVELEEVRVIEDWSDYQPEASVQTTVCSKHQRRLVIKREQNSCTKDIRDKGEQYWEYRDQQVECPCEVLNTPTWEIQDVNITWDTKFPWSTGVKSINAHLKVYNAATWTLILEARPVSFGGWTEKDRDDATVKCGKHAELTVHRENHDWNYWRWRLLKDGVEVASASYQHP